MCSLSKSFYDIVSVAEAHKRVLAFYYAKAHSQYSLCIILFLRTLAKLTILNIFIVSLLRGEF
jgi:hypothetical protein